MDNFTTADIMRRLGLTAEVIAQRSAAIGIEAGDRVHLQAAWGAMASRADSFVENLYEKFSAVAELRELLFHQSRMGRN